MLCTSREIFFNMYETLVGSFVVIELDEIYDVIQEV